MTKTFKYLSGLLCGALATGLWSCSADEYSMPDPDVNTPELVEGVAFTVEHDAQNPNIIHLTSLVPSSYQVTWETPQGRKNGETATLSIPFDGDYQIRMGINTRGGYVWSEPYTFTVDDFCAEFVDNYLWTRISGGVGNSKTWQLDLGVLADGSTKVTFWKGPHYFFTPYFCWENLHAASETENSYNNYMDADPWDAQSATIPNTEWYWTADYPSNSWMCSAENYGYMTFDLIGGANVTITDANGNVVSKGTYMLDPEAHTLTFSDCYPLESTDTRTHVREFNLLYLSDNALQILSLVAADAVSLNYVTKDYFENYVEPQPEEIVLPEGWLDAFNTQNKYGSWKLNADAPFNWYDLVAQAKTTYGPSQAYPSQFTPVGDTMDNFKLDFDNPETGKYTVTLPDGSKITGTYTVSDKGVITLAGGIGNSELGASNTTLSTGDDLTLQVLGVEKDDLGRLGGITLGRLEKDINGDAYQYIGYNFVADYGVATEKTYKATLTFSNTSDWNAVTSETVFIKGDGNYTAKVNYTWSTGDPLMWLEVAGILKDKPNCDIKILAVRLDGVDVPVDDTAISRGPGDVATNARRYVCNAWGLASCFPSLDLFKIKSDAEVDFQVIYDNGTPFPVE